MFKQKPHIVCLTLVILFFMHSTSQGEDSGFLSAKTVFQTNTGYDERLAIAVDGVIVHRHAAPFENELRSWKDNGFQVGRMFFADSDAGNIYWTGKWDGVEHPGDVERNQNGGIVKCANVRPYMLPTDGWIGYLEEMTDRSLAAGAGAILPEEPLAHVFTGYEESFKQLWRKRYGRAWVGPHENAEARFLTAQLKNELYIELERRLLARTRQGGANAAFILPIHSIYSNIAAQLVAPLGTSCDINGVDGYIGQIWTGPVNWALAHYDSPRKSFFNSAYVLYDYFTQLTACTDKKLYLLVDPVEDNPDHKWSEFAEWYKHCVVAMLLMDEVESYEIMPWPDRIFLPGYDTGGGTPAPEDYRITIAAVTQVLQEIEVGGQWFAAEWPQNRCEMRPGGRIGVAVADTLMWQRHEGPWLQGMYGALLPAAERGIPISSFLMERACDREYISRFKIIVLSYESLKPADPAMHEALKAWVQQGGVLIVLGDSGDELDRCDSMWWRRLGFESALEHLISQLDRSESDQKRWRLGEGWVFREQTSSRQFADPATAGEEYIPLLERAAAAAELPPIRMSGSFCMQRGPFVIIHADSEPVSLTGPVLDIFHRRLKIVDNVRLQPGRSGLYRAISSELKSPRPTVLHTTHRLVWQVYDDGILTLSVKGPAETPGLARISTPRPQDLNVIASSQEQSIEVDVSRGNRSVLLRFANAPEGVTIKISH